MAATETVSSSSGHDSAYSLSQNISMYFIAPPSSRVSGHTTNGSGRHGRAGPAHLTRRAGPPGPWPAGSDLRRGAEQREHAAVRVGEVGDDHAVLQRHRRDDDLAAEPFGPCGGRGDVRDPDNEYGVRRDVAAGIEDAAGGTVGASSGDQGVGAVRSERPVEEQAVERLRGLDIR